ncbi:MAG: hypothetical protein CR962_01410 [Gammaproteobacteria bacterium]|nr:MAG: hypothetical protein CR962_01410 [Gammaproteobacteria bacterium]
MEMLTKRIDFQLKAKKIAPDFIPGFFMGRGHGYGPHGNKMGNCWNRKTDAPSPLNTPCQK